MVGWLGILLVIIALWYQYFLLRGSWGRCAPPVFSKNRNLDAMRGLTNEQLGQFYQNVKGQRNLDSCYPDVSDQFAGMFAEQSNSANSGLRIGDVPPEIFY